MTFGQIKSIIENNLLESYRNEQEFKKSLREFKHNVLSNKNMSKLYSLYDQLTTPQGLSENDAKDFLDEGINLIQKLLPTIKTPKTINENVSNKYSDVDALAYTSKLDLMERLKSRKNLIRTISSPKKENIKETFCLISVINSSMDHFNQNTILVMVQRLNLLSHIHMEMSRLLLFLFLVSNKRQTHMH